jgi:preprotein translocase subunit SecG
MITVVLVIHLLIAVALVGVILIQRSEGGALSGLGGGTMGGLMSARGTANLLTRATAILAACFITTSVLLAILASQGRHGSSILDSGPAAPTTAPTTSAPAPATPAPAPAPAPAEPAAPIAN